MPSNPIPQEVVDKDHDLEGRSARAGLALSKHRWQHTTLNPNGPRYSYAAYARAVGRDRALISRHARAYELFVERTTNGEPGSSFTIEDALRLAAQSAENQEFSEAIAEGSGEPVARIARGDQRRRRNEIIDRARQREERRGGSAVDHARDIAAEEARVAAANRERREADRDRRSLRYVAIEGHLAAAQSRLTRALREAEHIDFAEDEMELIRDSLAKVHSVLQLLDLRMGGELNVDWEAELANLGLGDPA